ncbi:hypothetical protein IC757_05865 [Wenzhouxiangella sp. AB-CW3]|uniref:hypothetical protein n=1 Tax=Wenzhouxiangella sp. AB-CW3 TaxID=2771012 RepID=UPI00168BF4EB|nr:hypothetical protein [Wenzhouxiangella sp. AB-CW3]QOC23665.1 hypothetical protein IC757_05865 [Wenzhouxiangella sp. AB-CW3]
MARIRFVLGFSLLLTSAVVHANYVVNSNTDAPRSPSAAAGDCDTGNVVPAPGAGFEPECTLRAAIQTANLVDSGSLAIISFASHIPTSGGNTVFTPATALPDIETPIRIDGTSHPNYDPQDGFPRVILDGNSLTESAHGLRITADGSFSEIISLNIIRFSSGAGIQMTNADNVLVGQSQIGQFLGSNVPAPNNWGIRILNGNNNQIGGTSQFAPPIGPWRNVISGNTASGIEIAGDNNRLGRNHIGVSPIGDQPTPNGAVGVSILGGQGNEIGHPQGRSVIAANGGGDVLILQSASQTLIRCSFIGTNAAGDGLLSPGPEPAIEVVGNGHTIGQQGCANRIAGQVAIGRDGQFPESANFNTVEYNFVGTNPDGDDLGTDQTGIFVLDGEGNEILHNTVGFALTGIGLGVNTVNNFVRSNFVGVNADGDALPVMFSAIRDAGQGNGNNIGGSQEAWGNVVGHAAIGIELAADSTLSRVEGNLVGVTPGGAPAPVTHGIQASGSQHQIGTIGTGNRVGHATLSGIRLMPGSADVSVADNRIGTEPMLDGGFGSDAIGIRVSGADHQIGSFNYIGGMDRGIRVFEGTHDIFDNRLGIDEVLQAYPIATHGILLGNGSSSVRVIGNWIGHSTRGIRINSSSPFAVVGNNWVGVTPDGDDIGNTLYGLYTTGSGTMVGVDPSTSDSMPNVFGFNGSGGGVRVGSDNAQVINNYIGSTPAGLTVPNGGEAGLIILESPQNVRIGLSAEISQNIIRGNAGHGISVRSAGPDVEIGVNSIRGNGGHGILIGQGVSDVVMQSSVDPSLGSLDFYGNEGSAIAFDPDAGAGNSIRRVLQRRHDKGIDLGPGGRDQDPGDADTGPNNLQNYPEFDELASGFNPDAGNVEIRFRVDSAPGNSAYPIVVDVYRSDPAGSGLLMGWIGTVVYEQADAQEFVEVSLTPVPGTQTPEAESWFVAVATDNLGNSSEVSEPFGGPPRYTIGGVVNNLAGNGMNPLVLQNNGGDDLDITQAGTFSFQFDTPVPDGFTYEVSVSQQPDGQSCTVSNGSGTVDGDDVNDVQVICDALGDVIFTDRFEFDPILR